MNESGMPGVIVIAQADGEVPLAEELQAEGVEVIEVEHEEADTFPPFDATTFPSQLLWLAITFVAFYLLMARVVLPRIGGILEDRRDRIANDLDQASRLKQQSDDAITSYERALAEARSGAYAIANEARDASKAAAAAKQKTIDAELNQKLIAAEKRIGEIKDRALADVGAVAAEAAEAVVERLLGAKPTAAEVNAAVTAANRREGADA